MNMGKEMLSVARDAKEVIPWITDALTRAGFCALRSFDLQSACAPYRSPCPHHRTVPCSCQLVVLMVYDWNSQPHAVTIHGCDGYSQIGLIESPGHSVDEQFTETLLLALEAGMPVEGA